MCENFAMKKEWARYELTKHLKEFSKIHNEVEEDLSLSIIRELLEVDKSEKWNLLEEIENISELVTQTLNLKVIKFFMEYGVTFNTECLMIALQNDCEEIALFLIDSGVKLDYTCKNHFTPLEYLLSNYLRDNYFLVEKLLQKGVEPNSTHKNLIKIFLENWEYYYSNYKDLLKLLIKYNINVSYNNNEVIYYTASCIPDYETFDILLNAPTCICDLATSFRFAAINENTIVLKGILTSNALNKREVILDTIKYFADKRLSYTNFLKVLLDCPIGEALAKDILPIVQKSNHTYKDIKMLKKAIRNQGK